MNKNKRQMDERQLWQRGSIYKHMLILAAALLLINAFVQDYYGRWAPGRYESILLLLVIVAVGSVEMIAKDAYLIPGGSRHAYIILMAVTGLVLLAFNITHMAQNGLLFWAGGQLTEEVASLILGALMLSIPVASLIHGGIEKRNDRREDT